MRVRFIQSLLFLTAVTGATAQPLPTPSPVPRPVSGENLSLGEVSITGSSWDSPTSTPWSAKDDSYLTHWECTPGEGAWLEMDLGRQCRVFSMAIVYPSVITGVSHEDLQAFDIRISARTEHGDVWADLYTVTNDGSQFYSLVEFTTPKDMRYARLTVQSPQLSGGASAKVVEWQIWGESLESYPPAWVPLEQSQLDSFKVRLAVIDALCGEARWTEAKEQGHRLIEDLEGTGLLKISGGDTSELDFVWSKSLLSLGFAYMESGDNDTAEDTWKYLRDNTPVRAIAAAAATKLAHYMLPQARLAEAGENLTYALGIYPQDSWPRIELITFFYWSGDHESARLMANEVFDLYPESTRLDHVAWAELKLTEIAEQEQWGDSSTSSEIEAYQVLWDKYRDTGRQAGQQSVVADVAFRCKMRICRQYIIEENHEKVIEHGEDLLSAFPDKPGGWSSLAHGFLSDAYIRLRRFSEARAHIDALESKYPHSGMGREAARIRATLDSQESRYRALLGEGR